MFYNSDFVNVCCEAEPEFEENRRSYVSRGIRWFKGHGKRQGYYEVSLGIMFLCYQNLLLNIKTLCEDYRGASI